MDMTIAYTNSKNETIEFGPSSIFHYKENALHNYEWDYIEDNGVVTSFHRSLKKIEFPVVIEALSAEEGLSARNYLNRVFETDILAETPGTLKINDYSLRCWVVANEKDKWWLDGRFCEIKLNLLIENPSWVRERTFSFEIDRGGQSDGWLDFPFGFPFDFSPNRSARYLVVDSLAASSFSLTIYGPASSPAVLIGSNRYQVNVTVPDNGLLVIDPQNEKHPIVLFDASGNQSDVFHKRLRGAKGSGEYIFEPIPSGHSEVSWDNTFGWDLTVRIEESESPWKL